MPVEGIFEKNSVLLVRHLPSCLLSSEKEDMLRYFGATGVRVMPTWGRLKHTAFATFEDHAAAKKAIERLHQVEILNSVLSVEFAKEQQTRSAEKEETETKEDILSDKNVGTLDKPSATEKTPNVFTDALPPIAPHFGLKYPANPGLKYKYPPPTADILINICSALLTVPRLYTQVLHLMNKLNLVPPFNPATTVPPMLVEHIRKFCNFSYNVLQENKPTVPRELDKLDVVEMSESESEYESSEENNDKPISMDMNVPERVLKARKRRKKESSSSINRKKQKLKELISANTNLKLPSTEIIDRSDAFDETKISLTRKPIDIKVPPAIENSAQDEAIDSTNNKDISSVINVEKENSAEGFGRIMPLKSSETPSAIAAESTDETVLKDYITERQLDSGRLTKKEMSNSSLYKKYEKGEPTCRLYIKNLSKQVTEKDLKFIFGRFVNFSDVNESNMFDVRVMTQGRMKGQAFIGMPSIEAAKKALDATNGYQLINKPMVVHFARSAKPK